MGQRAQSGFNSRNGEGCDDCRAFVVAEDVVADGSVSDDVT